MAKDKIKSLEKKLKNLQSKPDTGASGRKKVDVLSELARVLCYTDPQTTEKYARQALALAIKLRYISGIARCYNSVSSMCMIRGAHNEALKYAFKSVKACRKLGDRKYIVHPYINIGSIKCDQGKYKTALEYFLKAKEVSRQNKDKNGIADACTHMGTLNKIQGNYDKALQYHSEALKLFKEINDNIGIAQSYGNIGNVYRYQGNYEKALACHLRALKPYEKAGNLRGIAFAYNNIGSAYDNYGDQAEALKYFFKALKLKQKLGDKKSMAISYNNIAVAYGEQGDYLNSLKNSLRALELHTEVENKAGIVSASSNIGLVYLHEKKYKRAEKLFLKSLKISEELGNKGNIISSYIYMGVTNLKLKRFDAAQKFLMKGLYWSRKNGQKPLVIDCCQHLSELFKKQNKYAQALKYYEMYHQVKQEVYNAEKTKQIAEMRTKYELEKKEKEAEIYHLRDIKLRKEIKERKCLERELKKHRDQLEELVAERTVQLRSLAHELSLVEEKQRRKIATFLHDEINQKLALAAFRLDALEKVKSVTKIRKEQKEIKKIIDQTAQFTRSLTFEISPPVLYEFGLEAAIEWLVRQFSKQYRIPCKVKDDGKPKPVTDDTRILLFQSVRELLANISKHARANSVTVSTTKENNVIRIEVKDDGVGFDTRILNRKIAKNEGFGLFNVMERLQHMRGQLEVKSTEGHGTSVMIVAPLQGLQGTTSKRT